MDDITNNDVVSNNIVARIDEPQIKMNVYACSPMPVYGVDYMTNDDWKKIREELKEYYDFQDLIDTENIFKKSDAVRFGLSDTLGQPGQILVRTSTGAKWSSELPDSSTLVSMEFLKNNYTETKDLSALFATSNEFQQIVSKVNNLDITKADKDYVDSNFAKLTNGYIDSTVIRDGSIVDAKILGVSANKLTAGTIDASKITVTNLNADNLTVGTINGQRIGNGSIDLDKLSQEVPTKEYLDSIASNLQGQIDGAIETWTSAEIPTLYNYPAEDWDDEEKQKHIGDILYVVNAGDSANGFCYRFVQEDGYYQWVLIQDNEVTKVLQDLIDIQGDLDGLKSFESTTSRWIDETTDSIDSLAIRTYIIETEYSKKDYVDEQTTSAYNNAVETAISSVDSKIEAVRNDAVAEAIFSAQEIANSSMAESKLYVETMVSTKVDEDTFKEVKDAVDEQSSKITTLTTTTTTLTTTINTANDNASQALQKATEVEGSISDAVTNASEAKAMALEASSSVGGAITAANDATQAANQATQAATEATEALATITETVETVSQTINDVKQTADTNSQTISTLSTTTATLRSDLDEQEKSVTDISNTVNAVKQTADSNTASITSLNTTISDNKTEIGQRATAIEQDLNGFKTSVSSTYLTKDEMEGYSTTEQMNSAIQQSANSITTSVSSTYATKTEIENVETRISSAEQKITDEAIVSTVRSSTAYTNDLGQKVSTGEIISSINQTAETITIEANKLDLKGYLTITAGDTNYDPKGAAKEISDNIYTSGTTTINGGKITTGSIDASKISVEDLYALDATIGGFNITDSSIYSGLKASGTSTSLGLYLDKNGNFNFGNEEQYIQFLNGKMRIETDQYHVYEDDDEEDHVALGSLSDGFYVDTSRNGLQFFYAGENAFSLTSSLKYQTVTKEVEDWVYEPNWLEADYFYIENPHIRSKIINGITYYDVGEERDWITDDWKILIENPGIDRPHYPDDYFEPLIIDGYSWSPWTAGNTITCYKTLVIKTVEELVYAPPFLKFGININPYKEDSTSIFGDYAVAIGNNVNAYGNYSFAQGTGNTSVGENSMAVGNNVIATPNNSFVCGKYNDSDSQAIFQVGCGTSDEERQNAFEITEDGNMYAHKDIYMDNNIHVMGKKSDGSGYLLAFDACSAGNNCAIGYGGYAQEFGTTKVYGNDVQLISQTAVHITKVIDSDLKTPDSGSLIIGSGTGEHLTIDNNEIMAKKTGTTSSVLYLNSEGGLVQIGSGGLTVSGNVQVNGTTITCGSYTLSGQRRIAAANTNNNVVLHVDSNAGIYHFGNTGYATQGWITYIQTNGTIVRPTTSDARLKDNLGEISDEEALIMLEGLTPINYIYKNDEDKIVQNGFIAQEVRDLLKDNDIGYRSYLNINEGRINPTEEEKEMVFSDTFYDLDHNEDDVVYSLDYSKFVPLLLKGWQMQQKQIDELKAEIEILKNS